MNHQVRTCTFILFSFAVLCVLGNKCDLENEREVSKEDALEYARSINASYYETSALSSEGV